MRLMLIAAASVLALAACGGPDADENPGDLNVVDNHVGPGNVFEPPTGNGSTITPTENGLTIEFPDNGAAPAGNAAATGGNAAQPAGNGQ